MSRISRAYFPKSTHSRSSNMQGYAFMLTRDIPLGIMPFRNSRSGSTFNVKLARSNPNLEAQLKDFIHMGQYGGYDLADSMIGFVDSLTPYLVTFGEVYLEIVAESTASGLEGKSLKILPLGKIIKLFKWYAQIVPFKDWKRKESKVVFIPAERIWHMKLPHRLGSPRQHRKLLKRLNLLAEPMPTFIKKDGDIGQKAKYDFMLHHNNKVLAVENLTHTWGSIPSLRQIKGTTEYYYIIHSLQFSYSQALLREHMIRELNQALTNLGIRNSIRVNGLAQATDIKNAISQLQEGEIGFKEALDASKESQI